MMSRSTTEINEAVDRWIRENNFHELDSLLVPFLVANPYSGWLREARKARLLSRGQVAKKMKTTLPAVQQLEASEKNGTISVRKMKAYAEALECELIYALRPKDGRLFSFQVVEAILPEALKDKAPRFSWARINALATKMSELFLDPVFRKKQGWSRNPAGKGDVGRLLRRVRPKKTWTDEQNAELFKILGLSPGGRGPD